jgi:hypothetical protein
MKSYIYSINYKNEPIYIGSSNNIEYREKKHQICLSKVCKLHKKGKSIGYYPPKSILYNKYYHKYHFLYEVEIKNIQLIVLEEVDEKYRYEAEEKHIINIIDNGKKLFNIIFPKSGKHIPKKNIIEYNIPSYYCEIKEDPFPKMDSLF